jgi:hypothetical protein
VLFIEACVPAWYTVNDSNFENKNAEKQKGRVAMDERKIEDFITEYITGEKQKNALEFVKYLRENEMVFYRDKSGYWADKLYWWVSYNGKYMCFILVNGYERGDWVIWFEDADTDCFADYPADAGTKEIAWANVDIFHGDCGGGQCEGFRKVIFGREFESLYRTLMCFTNPDAEATRCMKELARIWLDYIE